MCLVVDCSEKSVKSHYFGVIIYNWWRKIRKIGYSLIKMLISLKIYTKTPNTQDFHNKNSQFKQKLGIFDEIFLKNREIHIIWYKINHKSNNLGRKLRKIGFFGKTGTNFHTLFLQISICGYKLTQKLKNNCFTIQIYVVIFHKLYLTKTSTIIVENTKNSPNSSSYTIENKIVRNSHLLSHKNWHLLKCHSNCSTSKRKLLMHKAIKAAIDCSYIYCEGKYDKVSQTRTFFSSNALLWSLVLKSQLTFPRAKYKTNKLCIYY